MDIYDTIYIYWWRLYTYWYLVEQKEKRRKIKKAIDFTSRYK